MPAELAPIWQQFLEEWREDLPLVLEGKDPCGRPSRHQIEKFVPAREVVQIVAEVYNVSVTALTGSCRESRLVEARRICAMIINELKPGKSLAWIGRAMNTDHSTIKNRLANGRTLAIEDREFAGMLEQCREVVLRHG